MADKNTALTISFEQEMALSILHKKKSIFFLELLKKLVLPKICDNSFNVLENYSKISIQAWVELYNPKFISK